MYVYGDQDTISGGSWIQDESNVEFYLGLVKMNNIMRFDNPYMKKWD